MDLDSSTKPASSSRPTRQGWPWGQIGLLLFGLSMSLQFLNIIVAMNSGAEADGLTTLAGLLFGAALVAGLYAFWQRWSLKSEHQKPPRSDWLRRINHSVGVTVIVLCLVTLLVPAIRVGKIAADRSRLQHAPKATAEGEWIRIHDAAKTFSIAFPANWVDHPIPGNGAYSISKVDPSHSFGVTATAELKSDFTIAGADAYSGLVLQQLKEGFDDAEVVETTHSSIPGKPARQIRLSATVDGVKLVLLVWFLDTPRHYVQLRAFSLPSLFEDNEGSLRRSLGSFQVTGN